MNIKHQNTHIVFPNTENAQNNIKDILIPFSLGAIFSNSLSWKKSFCKVSSLFLQHELTSSISI